MNNEKNVPEPESQKPLSILSLVNLSNDVDDVSVHSLFRTLIIYIAYVKVFEPDFYDIRVIEELSNLPLEISKLCLRDFLRDENDAEDFLTNWVDQFVANFKSKLS